MTVEEAIDYLKNPLGKSVNDHKEAVKLAVKALEMMGEKEKKHE